ncbi:MUC5B protein, partial [Polypterus senegalus]
MVDSKVMVAMEVMAIMTMLDTVDMVNVAIITTRVIQAMEILQDVVVTRVATSHTDNTLCRANLPISQAGILISESSTYIKVTSKIGLVFQWNKDDALLLEIDEKYVNQTCGLCGDFNHIQIYDEFIMNGVKIDPQDFGRNWKISGPTETCTEPTPSSKKNCETHRAACEDYLSDKALDTCNDLVSINDFVDACIQDMCDCDESDSSSCVCNTISEYSRQCAHAGGQPKNWRKKDFCTEVTIFSPSTFYIIMQTSFGLQIKVQLVPLMQVYLNTDVSHKGQTSGLCGNFNNIQVDDFKAESGALEGTAASFCNSWKTKAICEDMNDLYDNPCAASIENEKYAQHWCSLLSLPTGPFAKCHSVVSPAPYQKNCLFDTCSGSNSEDRMCASISAYVRICAFKGIQIDGWRDNMCDKFSKNCPSTMTFSYSMTSCNRTCRSISEPDPTCRVDFTSVDGCGCSEGTYLNDNGKCVEQSACPCYLNGVVVKPEEVITKDGASCTCKNRIWDCTEKQCQGTCAIYGDGHYITFDGKRFNFNGDCEYTLTQNNELKLSDGHFEVLQRETKLEVPYKVRVMGIYLVIEADNSLTLMWDRKTSMFIKLSPSYKGNVCGLCGNYDGDVNNDFTTRSQSVVVSVMEFGNSWKASPSCPDAQDSKDPCISNPYRQSWAQKQCSIIKSQVFTDCHPQVDPSPFHDACVRDSCACDTGGDCECFCTAVASYAKACNDAALFCDYYNAPDGCEWHYKPCGAPCMKTCRNPTEKCSDQIIGLEGCYPKCPPNEPIFDEDSMKCVPLEQCGCFDDDDGKHYMNGDIIPAKENCQTCKCASTTVQCSYDATGAIVYNTTDADGWCYTAVCEQNCEITKSVTECHLTTSPPQKITSARPSTTEEKAQTSQKPTTAAPLTTPSMNCDSLNPPRKFDETWQVDKCTTATCKGGSVISLNPVNCKPAEPVVCENGRPPVKVYDDSGCCFHYECECFCSGWDNSHYTTFDGTYYNFKRSCSYVLVKEITSKNGEFKVILNNQNCDDSSSQDCAGSLTVLYKAQKVTLDQQDGKNKVFFNEVEVGIPFTNDVFTITGTQSEVDVKIAEIDATITYTRNTFSILLPYSDFNQNTEGLCGTCDNNKENDARLPDGTTDPSFTRMPDQWLLPTESKPECTNQPKPTPTPTSQTTQPTCKAEVCDILNSKVFEDCQKVIPVEIYYTACQNDVCSNPEKHFGCSSLEAYASKCLSSGICVDWRGATNGKCDAKDVCVYNNVEFQGSEFEKVEGQCCGRCVEKSCVIVTEDNTPHLLQPGEIWPSTDDKCTSYTCSKQSDHLITVETKMQCEDIDVDDCIPVKGSKESEEHSFENKKQNDSKNDLKSKGVKMASKKMRK